VASKEDPTWPLLDRIIAVAQAENFYASPWSIVDGAPKYTIDEMTLNRLLGVPLLLGSVSQSGLLAKPLDVWVAHELRRAGFDADFIWPRQSPPRVLPAPVARLIAGLPKKLQAEVRERVLRDAAISGVTAANADILGKLYQKQVDAGMSRWQTGPEALVSTKRMDSSFGANAKNRAEESYGDAKNLRLRYPLAALGFVFALRSTILEESSRTYAQMVDALTKLGEEEDAYHATCLLMIEYADADVIVEKPDPSSVEALDAAIEDLPDFSLRWDAMPEHLRPDTFLTKIINRVLEVTPNDYHVEARRRRGLELAGGVPEA
jgi:hypothetical protein